MIEDKLLLWRYNRGDREVVRQIYGKYKDNLVTTATALLYDKSAAEDVVHEVFVRFIRAEKKIEGTGNLKGYLMRCVGNGARNWNKAGMVRRSAGIEQLEGEVGGGEQPGERLEMKERQERLLAALEELPYEQREAVVLHVYSGMRFKAIAEIQGESENTVQGRYRYGREKLRSLLNGEVEL
ncbi:MAG: sigma-70 family RNA polymerase sigma factor [Planctomycetes bacterium]|nr:sigma-70 family RNA polymerase sigma factor [Planctomycetota bacterium]